MDFLKLNFGCGENRIAGFQNFDRDLDVTILPLPFKNECAIFCMAEHLGEHLNAPQLLRFLQECHRMLIPNGVMRLCCPVVGTWLPREHAIDLATNHGHQLVLNEESMRTFLWMAGFDEYKIKSVPWCELDGHYKIIGKAKDDAETCRLEATK